MTRRLLVVDDDRQMVRTFRDLLSLHGWETDGAFSGEEALSAIDHASYQAVLMDIRMPGMNGVEALAVMKERRPETRVILMTAYTAAALLEDARKEGALGVIPKPVRLPALLAMLEDAMRARGQVLVVDDDPGFLHTLSQILRRKGYDAIEAEGLDEAVDHLTRASTGVVLLDLRLDHLEPEEALRAIRTIRPSVTIILYSGHPRLLDETMQGLPPRWVHAALEKPFAPERLLELLEEVVDG